MNSSMAVGQQGNVVNGVISIQFSAQDIAGQKTSGGGMAPYLLAVDAGSYGAPMVHFSLSYNSQRLYEYSFRCAVGVSSPWAPQVGANADLAYSFFMLWDGTNGLITGNWTRPPPPAAPGNVRVSNAP